MVEQSPKVQFTAIPVEVRRTEYGDGEAAEAVAVHCPRQDKSIPLSRCLDCDFCSTVGRDLKQKLTVWCRGPLAADRRQVTTLAELEKVPVSEVMTPQVTCVDSELSMGELSGVFQRQHIAGAPVVEDEGVLLGMVNSEELPCAPPVGTLVEDVMAPSFAKVSESAPLGEALRLMFEKRLRRLPVVTDEDVVVGVISTTDVVRWMWRQMRYTEALRTL
jgi:CBS domain-containing protein